MHYKEQNDPIPFKHLLTDYRIYLSQITNHKSYSMGSYSMVIMVLTNHIMIIMTLLVLLYISYYIFQVGFAIYISIWFHLSLWFCFSLKVIFKNNLNLA